MKRKFTSLFTLFLLVASSVFAQYTTDGLYTIQCVGTSKYMSGGTPGSPMPMIASVTDDAKFYIVQNTSDNTKYNIISMDQSYLASSTGSLGTLIENTEANRNSTTAGALVDIQDEGANPYRFETNTVAGMKAWNGQRGTDTQVGMGTSATTKYQWNLVRIGDMPATGVPVVSITSPASGTEVLPSASVDLEATASALDGATVTAVEFLVDDVKVGDGVYNATSEVWEYTWAGSASEATYAVTAKATSSTSQMTTSSAINVIVATNPAAITLTWPSAATTILPNKQITLKATASPATGNTIAKVEFFEGSNLIGEGTLSGDVYELDTYISEINTFSITAKVTDSESNEASSAAVDLTTSLTTEIKSSYSNFESGVAADDWSWQARYDAPVSYVVNANAPSAANRVLEIDFEGSTASGATSLLSSINGLADLSTSGRVYIRYAYAADNTTQKTYPNLWSSLKTTTPGTVTASAGGVFSTKAWNQTTATYIDAGNQTIFAALRLDNLGNGGKLYYDDIVMYYDPNSSGTDGTAPTAPSNATAPTVSDNQIILNWDEGYDIGIGIDSTYILRTTTSDAAPELTSYIGYSSKGLPTGLDMVGNWDVVGAVALGTKAFTDNTVTNGSTTSYTYAIVHKDYAYNYSDAVTVSNGVVTGLNKQSVSAFKCYGTKGAIELAKLPLGSEVSIFSMSGVKVYESKASSSDLTVDAPQGLYIIKALNTTQKVIVR